MRGIRSFWQVHLQQPFVSTWSESFLSISRKVAAFCHNVTHWYHNKVKIKRNWTGKWQKNWNFYEVCKIQIQWVSNPHFLGHKLENGPIFFSFYESQNCLKETKIVAVCIVHDVPSQNIEHEQKKSKFPDHWSLSHYFYQWNHNWLYWAQSQSWSWVHYSTSF